MVAYDLLSKTPLQRKLNGGGLLKTIVQDIEQLGALEYNSGRISIFSGDDRNLIGVLKNLNKNYFKDLNSELFAGSALIIETYLRNSSKLVKVHYINFETCQLLAHCSNIFLSFCRFLIVTNTTKIRLLHCRDAIICSVLWSNFQILSKMFFLKTKRYFVEEVLTMKDPEALQLTFLPIRSFWFWFLACLPERLCKVKLWKI